MNDLDFLKRWCNLLMDLFVENSNGILKDMYCQMRLSIHSVDSQTKSIQLKAYKAVLQDLYNMFSDFSPEVKKIMDETVKSSLGISITEFYNRKLKAILKRNKIMNEEEYYIVADLLSDTENYRDLIFIEKLNTMIKEFEEKK
jgi:hypothetical protein